MFRSLAVCALAVTALQGAVVFQHLPESNSTDASIHQIGGPVLADDFDPFGVNGGIIRAVWWGTEAGSTQWELTFHLGQLGGGGFGIPQAVPMSAGGTKYFVTAVGADPDGDRIFRYAADLPGTFFVQAGPRPFGQEYWFSVANASAGWSWAYAGAGPTIGDEHWSGVRSVGGTPCGDGGPHCGPWSQIAGRDFAFELEAVPEPGTWTLLLTGAALLAFGRRFR